VAFRQGIELSVMLEKFNEVLSKLQFIVGHNLFDINILEQISPRNKTNYTI
jgi:hypothetical protein